MRIRFQTLLANEWPELRQFSMLSSPVTGVTFSANLWHSDHFVIAMSRSTLVSNIIIIKKNDLDDTHTPM